MVSFSDQRGRERARSRLTLLRWLSCYRKEPCPPSVQSQQTFPLQGDCPQCPGYLYPLQTLLGPPVLGSFKNTGVQVPLSEIPIQ